MLFRPPLAARLDSASGDQPVCGGMSRSYDQGTHQRLLRTFAASQWLAQPPQLMTCQPERQGKIGPPDESSWKTARMLLLLLLCHLACLRVSWGHPARLLLVTLHSVPVPPGLPE
jgi:hypothetical protein